MHDWFFEMKGPLHFFATAILAIGLSACAQGGPVKGDGSITDKQRDLYLTRTEQPQPSPELTRALELDVAPWHQKGVKHIPVKLPPEAIKQSQEAALAAIDALPSGVAQNDFDRAWIVSERAKALRDLGRRSESIAAYEKLRSMPRTPVQDWYARWALSSLSDREGMKSCQDGKLSPGQLQSDLIYPALAANRGIGGWVKMLVDVEPDGSIQYVVVESSSNRAFEAPTSAWLMKQHWQTKGGASLGRRCFATQQMSFGMEAPWQTKIAVDEVDQDIYFTYHSVGAAIRVRAAARAEVLAAQGSAPAVPAN